MLTRPVAAAQAAVAKGASGYKLPHMYVSDTWKCGSLSFIFTHPPYVRFYKKMNNVSCEYDRLND